MDIGRHPHLFLLLSIYDSDIDREEQCVNFYDLDIYLGSLVLFSSTSTLYRSHYHNFNTAAVFWLNKLDGNTTEAGVAVVSVPESGEGAVTAEAKASAKECQ